MCQLCVHVWRPETNLECCYSRVIHLIFWDRVSLWNPRLTELEWGAGLGAALVNCLYLLKAWITSKFFHEQLFRCWGSNTGLHACGASSLLTNPSPPSLALKLYSYDLVINCYHFIVVLIYIFLIDKMSKALERNRNPNFVWMSHTFCICDPVVYEQLSFVSGCFPLLPDCLLELWCSMGRCGHHCLCLVPILGGRF